MRPTLLLTIALLVVQMSTAQECSYTYFQNGTKATEKCVDERYSGTSRAFDMDGKVIGEWTLSRSGMMSSVRFSFHKNGMVRKAEYSAHPDGGIQWYRSTTTFDEHGKKTGFHEESHDDHLEIIAPKPPATPRKDTTRKKPPKQETVECAQIYVSELWLDNRTGKDVVVEVTELSTKETTKVNIPKGQRAKVGEVIGAESYADPIKRFSLSVLKPSGKSMKDTSIGSVLVDDSRLKEKRKGFVHDLN